MKVHVTRSSVAAGDDIDAPHARVFMLPDDSSTEQILNKIIETNYLAKIAGGNATWVVTSQIPIAVIAEQWSGARMLMLSLEARCKSTRTDGEMRLHFEYHQQADPEAIYARLESFGVMNSIYDTILWLESESTGKRFPTVLFSADTDMVTQGWVTLTSTERNEVIVTQMTREEHRATAHHALSGYLEVEKRINAALGRVDLRCIWSVGAEQVAPSAKGMSFQEFKTIYRPPIIHRRDIFRTDGVAREIARITRSEFERDGGKLIVLE